MVEYFGPLASVSCASVSFCVAGLDPNNDFDHLAKSSDPTGGESTWFSTTPFLMGDHSKNTPDGNNPFLGVSCASPSLCAVVDAAGNVLTSTDPASSESTWTLVPVDNNPLRGVSCPSASLCVAVDSAGNVVTSTSPTGGESAWSVANVDGTTKLTSVSCASESLCVAVDATGNVLSSTDPTGGPAAWSVVPADPGHALTSVSCTPAGLCVAVDNAGYAVMSTFSPQTRGGGEPGGHQTGATTPTGPSPSILSPAPVSGTFSIAGVKVGNNGQIVLTLKAPDAGSFDALATAEIGSAAAGSREKTEHKTGRARKITYGTGSATVPGADMMTLTIKPTKVALGSLKDLRTLRVPVTIVFRPRSGLPTSASETVTVTVRYNPSPRRSRACSASKGACRGKR
jgi:hypothetical protein